MDLPIEGMHCASCVLSVNKTFGKIEGVEEVDADYALCIMYNERGEFSDKIGWHF